MVLVCLIHVRNVAQFIPGYLNHLRRYVDGFIALDEGSTDGSANLLAEEPKMLDIMRDRTMDNSQPFHNVYRYRLLLRAQQVGARWVLCTEAEERFEEGFLCRLRDICTHSELSGKTLVGLHRRVLWDSPMQYRVDGPWGHLRKYIMFRLVEDPSFHNLCRLHGPWYPAELDTDETKLLTDHNVYYSGHIRHQDRVLNTERNLKIDPERRYPYFPSATHSDRVPVFAPIPVDKGYGLQYLPEILRGFSATY